MTKITVDDDELEDCDIMVCIPKTDPLAFPDNLVGRCSRCDIEIQFRPKAPKQPKRICLKCALPDLIKQADAGTLEVVVSPQAIAEVGEAILKKKMH